MNQLSKIKDKELLTHFAMVVQKEREAICEVISYLSHIWERKLYLEQGYSSLFNFLVEKYHYSKAAAYRRIQAAKLIQREPKVLEYLKEAKLNLTTIGLIEPFSTGEKLSKLIEASLGKTKEEVEEILAQMSHKVEINKDKIRRLPIIKVSSAAELKCKQNEQQEDGGKKPERSLEISLAFSSSNFDRDPSPSVQDDSKEVRRVKIEFVADEKVAQKIERAKQLLRHKYPQGKLEDIFNEALELLLEKKDSLHPRHSEAEGRRISVSKPRRFLANARNDNALVLGMTKKVESRYIPQPLKREIWKRDQGKCKF